MMLQRRRYRDESDAQKIRQFLLELQFQDSSSGLWWSPSRWESWNTQVSENLFHFSLDAAVFLWETPEGRLAAVLHPDEEGEAVLQVHPQFHTVELEVEMVSTAETQFAVTTENNGQRLVVWCHRSDLLRQDLLTRRDYHPGLPHDLHFLLAFDQELPSPSLPPGFSVQSLGDRADRWSRLPALHQALGAGLVGSVPLVGSWGTRLDLVVIAPDGTYAGFCHVWCDGVLRSATVLPVAIHPDYRGRGLARALLTEGLQRARKWGATRCAGSARNGALERLYRSQGFLFQGFSVPWMKTW